MKIGAAVIGFSLIAACAASAEQTGREGDRSERLLAGKVPGRALSCVSLRGLEGNRSLAGDRILFETRGSLVYVNQLRDSCPSLDFGRALKTDTRSGLLCDGDVVTIFDPQTGAGHGACSLGAFVPYRRAR